MNFGSAVKAPREKLTMCNVRPRFTLCSNNVAGVIGIGVKAVDCTMDGTLCTEPYLMPRIAKSIQQKTNDQYSLQPLCVEFPPLYGILVRWVKSDTLLSCGVLMLDSGTFYNMVGSTKDRIHLF